LLPSGHRLGSWEGQRPSLAGRPPQAFSTPRQDRVAHAEAVELRFGVSAGGDVTEVSLASNNSAAISPTLLSPRIACASAPTDASWST
jgi:hypothetical protein